MARLEKDYLHGYSLKEQKRLYAQANFLEPYFYPFFDFSRARNLLEVGCGVGAQTKILLKRFPHLKIDAVDLSEAQLSQAQRHLRNEIGQGKVQLRRENAAKLHFKNSMFDSAFLCWFLEHVWEPVKFLKEIRRTLKSGGVIYCSEVQNSSLFLEPRSPAIMDYWAAFNREQLRMNGDPFVGAKLGSLLQQAGFKQIETKVKQLLFDSRVPKERSAFLQYWEKLLLSGAPALLKSARIEQKHIREIKKEFRRLRNTKSSVFFYTPVQAKAIAP